MQFSCPRSLSACPRPKRSDCAVQLQRRDGGGRGHRIQDVKNDVWRRHSRRQDTSTATVGETFDQSTTSIGSEMWDLFSSKVSGEWRGVMTSYDSNGKAIALPDNFVDDAFQEWDVRVFDWQTQCSMQASESGLEYKLRRLFAATGCEADSVAMTETVQALKSSQDRKSEDKTISSSGDYSIGPRYLPKDGGQMTIETCFGRRKMDHRLRVRIHLKNDAGGDLFGWTIEEVEVHKEVYQGEFVGGLDVEDYNKPVTKIERPETYYNGALHYFWMIDSRFTYGVDKDGRLFLKEKFAGLPRELYGWDVRSDEFIPLPEGLWCSLDVDTDPIGEVPWMTDEQLDSSQEEEEEYLSIQVGWLINEKRVLVCTREYHETEGLVTVDIAGCNYYQDLV